MVVFGVVLFVVIVIIMVVNWVKLILDECYFESIVLIVLLIFIIVGLIFVWMFLFLCICCNCLVEIYIIEIVFLRIKLILMYIFGLGFLFYCGFYIWKYVILNNCEELDNLGIFYNMLLIFYIFSFFIYFVLFYVRKKESFCLESCVLFGFFLVNLCIWLDIFFLELNVVFKYFNNELYNCIRVIEVIEKIDLFLFFVIIEFLLMVVNMLFINIDDFIDLFFNFINIDIYNKSNNKVLS